jgi:predicted RNA-binding Zn ribbon-like protein
VPIHAKPEHMDAGHPFLTFVNTVTDPGKTRRQDAIANGEDLLRELCAAGLDGAVDPPGQGQLSGLRALRESAYGVLSAIAAGRRPPREDALMLEMAIKAALADAQLSFEQHTTRWTPGPLGGLHDALALSLAALLQSDDLSRLRECRRCTRLFLDRGRGPGLTDGIVD